MANITNITPPRVPLVDTKTGLISREWYRFFLNLFLLVGSGNNDESLSSLLVLPPVLDPVVDFPPVQETKVEQYTDIQARLEPIVEQYLDLQARLEPIVEQLASLQFAFDLQPVSQLYVPPAVLGVATKTADFTLAAGELWVVNNKSGSSCTVTLPAASSWDGRPVTFQNYQAQTLVSASSNVVPLGGGAAGTAILPATVSKWATLVSNYTNWVIMQAA